jgi:threonine aldolase
VKLPIDLRSDTVTRPTEAMRRAMFEAEVGDDVLGEDPTVRELEVRTAAILGKEDALFVPSGTMGNEIALRLHARPGDEVLVEEQCHILNSEGGGAAALSGLQLRPLASDGGRFDVARVEGAIQDDDNPHHAQTALLCVENTHNRHGGRVYPLDDLRAVTRLAASRGLRVHMDGARLWNAAAALGVAEGVLAGPADSVMVCYSKGLGAPVGSALAGSRAAIHRARRERKMLGGGMRQAGVLAAACLHALDHHRGRLADDHARARRLVELAAPPSDVVVLGGAPETNIVIFHLPPRLDVFRVIAELGKSGVLLSHFGPGVLRAITHLDVDDDGIEHAGRELSRLLSRTTVAAQPSAAS